jgi:hypothetical protein
VVDASDRATFHTLAQNKEVADANEIVVHSGFAFLPDSADGLRIADIADPEHPHEVGAFPSLDRTLDVAVRGSLAYIADDRGGLRIIDLGPEYLRHRETDIHVLAKSGQFEVTIFGSADVHVLDIDCATIRFGPSGASPLGSNCRIIRDEDRDGFADMVTMYRREDVAWSVGDPTPCVDAEFRDGYAIHECRSPTAESRIR